MNKLSTQKDREFGDFHFFCIKYFSFIVIYDYIRINILLYNSTCPSVNVLFCKSYKYEKNFLLIALFLFSLGMKAQILDRVNFNVAPESSSIGGSGSHGYKEGVVRIYYYK